MLGTYCVGLDEFGGILNVRIVQCFSEKIYVHVNAVKSPFSIMTTQFWHPLLFFYWLANDVILAVVVSESPIEFVVLNIYSAQFQFWEDFERLLNLEVFEVKEKCVEIMPCVT